MNSTGPVGDPPELVGDPLDQLGPTGPVEDPTGTVGGPTGPVLDSAALVREGVKYYFADFVRKGWGNYPPNP